MISVSAVLLTASSSDDDADVSDTAAGVTVRFFSRWLTQLLSVWQPEENEQHVQRQETKQPDQTI